MNPPLDTNDAPLASPSSVATLRNGEVRPSCIVCRAKIGNNQWFCRLPQNGNSDAHAESVSILLCSPRCALRYFEILRPRRNGFESDCEQYDHTVQFLVDGERPLWL
jgi:hypothetical protein